MKFPMKGNLRITEAQERKCGVSHSIGDKT